MRSVSVERASAPTATLEGGGLVSIVTCTFPFVAPSSASVKGVAGGQSRDLLGAPHEGMHLVAEALRQAVREHAFEVVAIVVVEEHVA